MQDTIRVSLVRLAGRSAWYMQYRHPDTGRKVRRSTDQTNKRDAERAAAKWEAELRAGRDDRLGRLPWADFRRRYEDEVVPGLAEKTQKKIATVLNAVETHIAPQRLGTLNADALQRLQKALRDAKLSESTIKGYLSHLRAALNWAVGVGLLQAVPKVPRTQRAKQTRFMKGRPISGEEFERMLDKVEVALLSTCDTKGEPKQYKRWSEAARQSYLARRQELAASLAPSWQHLLRGLWWSGLRLGEALELHWTDESKLCVDFSSPYPMLRIPAELEKGNKDRLMPLAPEFAEFLLATPERARHGFVFNPLPLRADKQGCRLGEQQVGRVISVIGRLAGVKVSDEGKGKTASAHDLRRSFGLRWSQRVMPNVLMELMRHESIETTMRYYVGRNAQSTASVLWAAAGRDLGAFLGATAQETQNAGERSEPQTSIRKGLI
jgi:integrase